MATALRVTWKKSAIGYPREQEATLRSLGLRRMHQTVVVPDTPVFRGMVRRVNHLVEYTVVEEPAAGEQRQTGAGGATDAGA